MLGNRSSFAVMLQKEILGLKVTHWLHLTERLSPWKHYLHDGILLILVGKSLITFEIVLWITDCFCPLPRRHRKTTAIFSISTTEPWRLSKRLVINRFLQFLKKFFLDVRNSDFCVCFESVEFYSNGNRGAARIFLRWGWSYESKKPWKGKIACD